MENIEDDVVLRPLQLFPLKKKRELDEREILSALSCEFFHNWKKRWDFLDLLLFLLLVAIYYLLLWTQFDVKNSYLVNASLRSVLPQDQNGNLLSTFGDSSQIYSWINSSIVNSVWSEPTCGNGLCEPPVEIPTGIFKQRGCFDDCGTATKLWITFYIHGDDAFKCAEKNNGSTDYDCPWFDVKLNWKSLETSAWTLGNNTVTVPSKKSGSITRNGNYTFFPQGSTEKNNTDYAIVELPFQLNQGPYVRWYIDVPLIGSNVEIYVSFYNRQTISFVKSLGFSQLHLNSYFIWSDEALNYTTLSYNSFFGVIFDKSITHTNVTGEINPRDIPYNISDSDISDSDISDSYLTYHAERSYGPPQSHVQLNIINPISMYADYLSSTPRTLDSSQKFSNRVLIGVLITLTRKQDHVKDCGVNKLSFNSSTSKFDPVYNDKVFGPISKWCQLSNEDSATQFGYSPLFNKKSNLYNKSIVDSTFDKADPWNTVPSAFNDFYSQGKNGRVVFFFLLDVDFQKNMVNKFLTYMQDGGFIDSLTDVLTLKILSFNSDFDLFSLLKVETLFGDHGSINIKNKIDFLPASATIKTKIFFTFYWIFLSIFILIEILEFFYYVLKNKSIHYIRWNIFDIITFSFFLTNGILWIVIDKRLNNFRPSPHYDVYEDKLFENVDVTILSNATYNQMFQQYEYFDQTLHLKTIYSTITCINSVFLVIRLIKLFDFNPKFGIISRTISDIGLNVLNLAILWVVISMGYAVAGILAFGEQLGNFRDLNYAFNSLGQILMGDITVNALYDSIYTNYFQSLPAHIYFWSYVFFSCIILINFVIAVTCYSFQNLHEYTRKENKMKNLKPDNELLFLLKNTKFIKSFFYLYQILKNYPGEKLSLKSLKDDRNSLNEIQEKEDFEDFGKGNSILDPISDIKSLYAYGVEVEYDRIYSIIKSKLSNDLGIQENLDSKTYDLVHFILCCYGVNKKKIKRKIKKRQNKESKNVFITEFLSLKKELYEIRSIIAAKSEIRPDDQDTHSKPLDRKLSSIQDEVSELKEAMKELLKKS